FFGEVEITGGRRSRHIQAGELEVVGGYFRRRRGRFGRRVCGSVLGELDVSQDEFVIKVAGGTGGVRLGDKDNGSSFRRSGHDKLGAACRGNQNGGFHPRVGQGITIQRDHLQGLGHAVKPHL